MENKPPQAEGHSLPPSINIGGRRHCLSLAFLARTHAVLVSFKTYPSENVSLLDATWTQHAYLRSSFLITLALSARFANSQIICNIPLVTMNSFLNSRRAALFYEHKHCINSLLWLIPLFCETRHPPNYTPLDYSTNGRPKSELQSFAYDFSFTFPPAPIRRNS